MMQDMITRIVNAETSFISDVIEQFGFTQEQATKILAVYKKYKIAKVDPVMGRVNIKHGAYWDKEPMSKALEVQP